MKTPTQLAHQAIGDLESELPGVDDNPSLQWWLVTTFVAMFKAIKDLDGRIAQFEESTQ